MLRRQNQESPLCFSTLKHFTVLLPQRCSLGITSRFAEWTLMVQTKPISCNTSQCPDYLFFWHLPVHVDISYLFRYWRSALFPLCSWLNTERGARRGLVRIGRSTGGTESILCAASARSFIASHSLLNNSGNGLIQNNLHFVLCYSILRVKPHIQTLWNGRVGLSLIRPNTLLSALICWLFFRRGSRWHSINGDTSFEPKIAPCLWRVCGE